MWVDINDRKPSPDQHIYVWVGNKIKLMYWDGEHFLPPKYDWHTGIDGKQSMGWLPEEYEMWFDIQPPKITIDLTLGFGEVRTFGNLELLK